MARANSKSRWLWGARENNSPNFPAVRSDPFLQLLFLQGIVFGVAFAVMWRVRSMPHRSTASWVRPSVLNPLLFNSPSGEGGPDDSRAEAECQYRRSGGDGGC